MLNSIVLIANYLPDKQESMERFTQMLYQGFREKGLAANIVRPRVVLGRFAKNTHHGLGKWLGYFDKYVLFFIALLSIRFFNFIKRKSPIYHICDHSNAVYIRVMPASGTFITCHDVLAIRGAFGYQDAYCEASNFGKLLQTWILHSLFKAKHIAFVSEFTKKQYLELRAQYAKIKAQPQALEIVYNGFNAVFKPLETKIITQRLYDTAFILEKPYLLHVGSALARKNRAFMVQLIVALKDSWQGNIVFAGQPIDAALAQLVTELGIGHRVICIAKPSHVVLEALYSGCYAFVFPSYSEGFGWPMVEAQACGAVVITSNLEPMVEVCGGGALHIPLSHMDAYVKAVLSLKDTDIRERLVASGKLNTQRFTTSAMIDHYLAFYKQTG